MPPGKQLVRPAAVFAIKTRKQCEGGEQGDKVFVNVVQSACVAKPTSVACGEGSTWSVPYSVGPPHMVRQPYLPYPTL